MSGSIDSIIGAGYTPTGSSSAAAAAMKKTAGMNKDDFLKLFITQLQNQDPLKPQDSSEFIAQLAQLTQVEQSYNTNSNLAALQKALEAQTAQGAVGFIGATVAAKAETVNKVAAGPALLTVNFPVPVGNALLDITDGAGRVVRQLQLGTLPAGDRVVTWDGNDANGQPVPNGTYRLGAAASDATGAAANGSTGVVGTVIGVELTTSGPELAIGSVQVPVAAVEKVRGSA